MYAWLSTRVTSSGGHSPGRNWWLVTSRAETSWKSHSLHPACTLLASYQPSLAAQIERLSFLSFFLLHFTNQQSEFTAFQSNLTLRFNPLKNLLQDRRTDVGDAIHKIYKTESRSLTAGNQTNQRFAAITTWKSRVKKEEERRRHIFDIAKHV